MSGYRFRRTRKPRTANFAALADDLDYYASKTTGGRAADGYLDAAIKIREVIAGTYPDGGAA